MFTTLRYVKDGALVAEREGHVLSHLACKACRSRKLKCTGENTGCLRCRSKDLTCIYPDPTHRTRRSKQLKAKPKRTPSEFVAPKSPTQSTPINPDHQALIRSSPGQVFTPTAADPWSTSTFLTNPNTSFFDTFYDGTLPQPLEFLHEDLNVEGAGIFPLDDFHSLNGFLSQTTAFNHQGSEGYASGPAPVNVPHSGFLTSSMPLQDSETTSDSLDNNWAQISANSITPPPTTTTTPSTCTCLPTTLHLLHTLPSPPTVRTIPLTIRLNKHILTQTRTLFTCPLCPTSPYHASTAQKLTLLTVLCQKVISSYELVVGLLTRQWYNDRGLGVEEIPVRLRADTMSYIAPAIASSVSDDEDENETGNGNGSGSGDRDRAEVKVDFKGYEVEASEEPCLFAGLITLQLGIMRAFLRKMRDGGEEGGWLGLVEEVDGRVTRLGRFCSRSCEP